MSCRCAMFAFEITAIDLILVIAVIVLLILYVTKLVNSPEELIKESIKQSVKQQKVEVCPDSRYDECPRGFGKIKQTGDLNFVPDRCLSCYRFSNCYAENTEVKARI